MKIIILGPAHPLRPGGITTFNERLCKAFIDSGHACSIWSFSLQYPGFLFPGTSQFTDTPAPSGITIRSIINSINPFNWVHVGMMLKKANPDLVVVRYWIPFMGACLGTILRFGKKNKHTKIVCIADNIIPHEKRAGDRILTTYFIKPVDAFVVMSEQVFGDLRQFTKQKAALLPHPLYDNFGERIERETARTILKNRFHINIRPEDSLLVFFGLVRHYKGLDLLLEAMPLLKNQSVKLLIAGEFYEDDKPYRQLIETYNLEEKVFLYPHFLPEEDVKNFICAGDCIIQPYRHATQSGVTPVAYHFEVPMIVTNVGGLAQMVPHGKAGLVCKPDPMSIASAVDTFFEKGKQVFLPGLLEEKKKLSWNAFTEGIIEVVNTP